MDVDIELILSESTSKLQHGSLSVALEYLAPYEKQYRNANQLASSTKILEHIIQLCYKAKEWKILNEQLILLSKKRGQIKQAIATMIQKALDMVESLDDLSIKLPLIETLRIVTHGKIFVEVERARLTNILSKIKEHEGNLKEAAEILFDLQIEAFGSMEINEKIDFFLEQMRLGLLINDYTRTQIISKKINVKCLNDESIQDKKLKYYEMMIQLALHEENYLECAKHYMHLYDTKSIKNNTEESLNVFKYIVLYLVLAPFDHEQFDLIHRINQDKNLEKIPLYKNLLECFLSKELMRWPIIEQRYFMELSKTVTFQSNSKDGNSRWLKFRDRVIEHNIRIISSYYSRISFDRLSVLLDSDKKSTEEAVSNLVINKTIYAKLDRPLGIIDFLPPKTPSDILNQWSSNIHELLDSVVKVNHLIAKEEVLYQMNRGS